MKINTNEVYQFTKSGNAVRVTSKANEQFAGKDMYNVERVDTGKQMLVSADSLVLWTGPTWNGIPL